MNKIITNQLVTVPQDNSKATYFGKRTPDDGLIDWAWNREKIYNWIRAQTFPYPGAFTYYLNNKVIIDWIELDDNGEINVDNFNVSKQIYYSNFNDESMWKRINENTIQFILLYQAPHHTAEFGWEPADY